MLPQPDLGGRDQAEPGGRIMNLEGRWRYLEGTWRVAKNWLNYLQIKKKDTCLAAEPGEQGPGRDRIA